MEFRKENSPRPDLGAEAPNHSKSGGTPALGRKAYGRYKTYYECSIFEAQEGPGTPIFLCKRTTAKPVSQAKIRLDRMLEPRPPTIAKVAARPLWDVKHTGDTKHIMNARFSKRKRGREPQFSFVNGPRQNPFHKRKFASTQGGQGGQGGQVVN